MADKQDEMLAYAYAYAAELQTENERLRRAFNDQSQRLQLALAENERLRTALEKTHQHAFWKPGCAACEALGIAKAG